jgi:hypothetical protein
MPMLPGFSEATVRENIAREIDAGHAQKQAVAMSLNNARKYFRKKHPGKAYPPYLRTKRKANPMKKRRTAAQKKATEKMRAGLRKWQKQHGVKRPRKKTKKRSKAKITTNPLHKNYYVVQTTGSTAKKFFNGYKMVTNKRGAAVWHDKKTAVSIAKQLAERTGAHYGVLTEEKKK